jgi:hypothetical protein
MHFSVHSARKLNQTLQLRLLADDLVDLISFGLFDEAFAGQEIDYRIGNGSFFLVVGAKAAPKVPAAPVFIG